MKEIGVIFDFNGTMFFDGKYHDEAWKMCVEDLAMKEITKSEVDAFIKGRSPKEILEHFMGYELSLSMVHQFSEEKERIYRSLIIKEERKNEKNISLSAGLEKFLDYLKNAEVPVAIVSSADLQNMVMYYDLFRLERWFDWDRIFFNDGKIKLKPEPDIYLAAISKIKVPARFCMAFEDSEAGVEAAYNAGIRNIVGVVGDSWNMKLKNEKGIIALIKDFTELNKDNFK